VGYDDQPTGGVDLGLLSDCGESLTPPTVRSTSEQGQRSWDSAHSHARESYRRYPELEELPAFHPHLESRESDVGIIL